MSRSAPVGQASAGIFEQVSREPRLSDKVADMMLETILSRRLNVGDRLPSERELDICRENLGSGSAPATLDQHERVLERIAEHDSDGARNAMSDHLEAVADWWRRRRKPE